jgi:exonuclease VII large subunit
VEPVDIKSLLSEYKDNEVRADSEFKGKNVRVTGKVGDIKKDLLDHMYVTVGTGRQFEIPTVQCMLNAENQGAASSLKKGQTITVEGEVKGLMMNVLIEDCDIAQ